MFIIADYLAKVNSNDQKLQISYLIKIAKQ